MDHLKLYKQNISFTILKYCGHDVFIKKKGIYYKQLYIISYCTLESIESHKNQVSKNFQYLVDKKINNFNFSKIKIFNLLKTILKNPFKCRKILN